MIKTMRDAAHNYPWLLKSIMGVLADCLRDYDGMVGIR